MARTYADTDALNRAKGPARPLHSPNVDLRLRLLALSFRSLLGSSGSRRARPRITRKLIQSWRPDGSAHLGHVEETRTPVHEFGCCEDGNDNRCHSRVREGSSFIGNLPMKELSLHGRVRRAVRT